MQRMQQDEEMDRGGERVMHRLRWCAITSARSVSYGEDTVESHRFGLLRILQTHNKAVLAAVKAIPRPHPPSVTPVLFWLTSSLSLYIYIYLFLHTHPHANTVTLDNISHTDDFRAGKITEHICRSSILIINWMVANFHYRLSFQSICKPPHPQPPLTLSPSNTWCYLHIYDTEAQASL